MQTMSAMILETPRVTQVTKSLEHVADGAATAARRRHQAPANLSSVKNSAHSGFRSTALTRVTTKKQRRQLLNISFSQIAVARQLY